MHGDDEWDAEGGKSTCYNEAYIVDSHEYLPCGECIMRKGIGVRTGGYCKW